MIRNKYIAVLVYITGTIALFTSCSKNNLSKKEKIQKAAKEEEKVPVYTPKESIAKMEIVDGFEVKLVASEPLISSPITMAFDNNMNIWVVELRGWVPIDKPIDKPIPKGRVSILFDTNSDGVMDSSKVFLDSLSMPRAIYIDQKGILLATPPNLWYIKRDGYEAGKRVLVDSTYTRTHNTEGQTNGLFRGLDNWIYSVGFGSNTRYRKVDGVWRKQPTMLRGQFGVTQDNYGRLYYNHHSTQLMGDYFMPGLIQKNKFQNSVAGFNELIVTDQHVYPAGRTAGANNPFRDLGKDLELVSFTAATGPLIYRGGLFGKEYKFNAFVAAPVGNLIKRNILKNQGYKVVGKQAYQGKEFLASHDERFRPVNLSNGPDGALYIVDMYRGVIEDSMWVTPYLNKYSRNHKLVGPIDMGRIYKVMPKNADTSIEPMPDDVNKLVKLLGSDNGWIRNRAQKILVEREYRKAIPILKEVIRNNKTGQLKLIHSLWTLDGLRAINLSDIKYLLNHTGRIIQKQVINIITEIIDKNNYQQFVPIINDLIARKDSMIVPNIAYLANRYQDYKPKIAKEFISKLTTLYPHNKYVADALVNGLAGREKDYLKLYPDTTLAFHRELKNVIETRKARKTENNAEKIFHEGFKLYQTFCQTCHGADGTGISGLGPPLSGSEWVVGSKDRLISIILKGLEGPVKVDGKVYKKPEISGIMPSFEDRLSDSEAARIVNYIRHAWENEASSVSSNDISIIRYKFIDQDKPFTADDLKKIFDGKSNN